MESETEKGLIAQKSDFRSFPVCGDESPAAFSLLQGGGNCEVDDSPGRQTVRFPLDVGWFGGEFGRISQLGNAGKFDVEKRSRGVSSQFSASSQWLWRFSRRILGAVRSMGVVGQRESHPLSGQILFILCLYGRCAGRIFSAVVCREHVGGQWFRPELGKFPLQVGVF